MRRRFGIFAAGLAAAVMAAGYVNSCMAAEAEPLEVASCEQGKSLTDARNAFVDPGDGFATFTEFDRERLGGLIMLLGAPPEMAVDHSAKAAILAVAASSVFPPGTVRFAVYDERECVLGSAPPKPFEFLNRALGGVLTHPAIIRDT